ncbi:MAG: hypothetical protein NG740_06670 [Omnitrophica bacterium]|nr:hypothetical protein [Candidatus Omnitrophota bacterium]
MKKYVGLSLILVLLALVITGCGETIGGMSKDINRVKRGIKTIFVRGD